MKFKNNFLFRIFKKRNSLNDALRKIAGKKRLERLLINNTDWRLLANEAAYEIGMEVSDLLHKVAEYFHVPYISRVPYIDLELLPNGLNLQDLRRMACIPRIGSNGITAFICLDPKRARMLLPLNSDLPMAIASWQSLQAALDESEAIYKAKHQVEDDTRALQAVEAAKQALHLVLAQVKTFNIESLDVRFLDDKITYSFITNEGKTAEGNIHTRVRSGLHALLCEFSTEEVSDLHLSDLARHSIKVCADTGRTSFNICMQNKLIRFPEPPVSKIVEPAPTHDGKERSILIVDDNQIFAKVLEKFLAKLNVKSHFASNGKEAIDFIRTAEIQPDLVICDLHMPEMNGCEFVRRIRGELSLPELPVIILTSDNDVETELKLLTDGADAFIAKSEDPRLLCVKIEKLLDKVQRRKAA